MNGFSRFVSQLTFKQLLMYVLIIVFIVIFLLWTKNKIKNEIAEIKEKKQEEKFKEKINAPEQVKKEMIPTDVSFSDSEYIQMCDVLFEAMNGVGTNTAKIKTVFQKLKTKTDFLKLVEFFGVRTLSLGYLWLTETGTLFQLLESELSANEKAEMNQILRNISVSI
ncbi:MAG: hypothetical protein M0R02_09360 [Bacteroidales bacterium]|nr:hypothetical protein [Bacteroidales bacterium]